MLTGAAARLHGAYPRFAWVAMQPIRFLSEIRVESMMPKAIFGEFLDRHGQTQPSHKPI